MNADLLNLWITRLRARHPSGVPKGLLDEVQAEMSIVNAIDPAKGDTRHHVVVAAKDARTSLSSADELTGWLAVDVPVSSAMNSTALAHRMLRRLYFAAVLHGLGEVPSLREAVQAMRISYLQTRGIVTTGRSQTSTEKLGGEVGASLDLTKPISVKLTAAEEVSIVENFSATMQRSDLIEAEDQLLCDLQMLSQLEILVNRYAQLRQIRLPRFEKIREFFKAMYADVRQVQQICLRPVFVLEAFSTSAAITLLRFAAEASALASNFSANLIFVGGPELAALWHADEDLGHPVLRGFFSACLADDGQPIEAARLRASLKAASEQLDRQADAPNELRTLVRHAHDRLGDSATSSDVPHSPPSEDGSSG